MVDSMMCAACGFACASGVRLYEIEPPRYLCDFYPLRGDRLAEYLPLGAGVAHYGVEVGWRRRRGWYVGRALPTFRRRR